MSFGSRARSIPFTNKQARAIGHLEFRTPLVFSNSECELCNCHLQFGARRLWTCQHCFSTESMPLDILNTNYTTIIITEFNIWFYDVHCARRSQNCLTAFAQEISKQSMHAPAYRVDDKTRNFGRSDINHVKFYSFFITWYMFKCT